MQVIVGTYEELILAFRLTYTDEKWTFESSFSDHTHTGMVKAVAASSNGILAAGSSDERMSLFNVRRNKEIGMLVHHDGSVTCIKFFGKSHMFSASADGTIGVWKVGNWECLRTLRGHKEPVYAISVHPSGKLALSVGKDKTLRTWNLITGKQAYVTNVKETAEDVMWSTTGSNYSLLFPNRVDVYSVETSEIIHTIKCSFRVQTMAYLKDDLLMLGGDGGKMELIDVKAKTSLLAFDTDTVRVKCMKLDKCPTDSEKIWITTGSSDGLIKVWEINQEEESWSQSLVAEVDSKFRILCLTTWTKIAPKTETDSGFESSKSEIAKETEASEDNESKAKKDKKGKRKKSMPEGKPKKKVKAQD